MKYQEAVSLLISGKYVTRPAWKDSTGYLVFLPGLTHFLLVTTQPKSNVVPWAADIESSSAEDWVEINPAIQVESVQDDAA